MTISSPFYTLRFKVLLSFRRSHISFRMSLAVVSLDLNSDNDTATEAQNTEDAFVEAATFVTAFVGYPLICAIGFVGNLLCLVVLNLKNMRNSTNVYLSALAVSDLMKNINDFMYFPTVLLIRNYENHKLYAVYYPFGYFLSQFAAICSAWLTVSVALERLLMVVYPHCSRGLLTIRQARIVSVLVYLFCFVFSIPCALRYRTVCRPALQTNATCPCGSSQPPCPSWNVDTGPLWLNPQFKSVYSTVQSCVRSLVPLVILIYLNFRIIASLHQTRASHRLASRNRITLLLIVVVCCFIGLGAPDAIMSLMGWGYHDAMSSFRKGMREITDMLLAMNSAINVFLYFFFNKAFREHIMALCWCNCCPGENRVSRGRLTARLSTTIGGRGCASCAVNDDAIPLRRPQKLNLAPRESTTMTRVNGSFKTGVETLQTNKENSPRCKPGNGAQL